MSEETELMQPSDRWAYWSVIMIAIVAVSLIIVAILGFFTEECHWENPTGNEEIRKCTSLMVDGNGPTLLGNFLMRTLLISFFLFWVFAIAAFGYWFTDRARKINDRVREGREARREETKLNAKKKASEHESQREYNLALKCWIDLKKYDNDSSIYDIEIIRVKKLMADEREQARDYDSAIEIWEELGEIEEAARVRKLKARQGSVRVAQKVVHGDEVTKTEIKDSVVSKSSIGAGGKSKMQELKELTEMKKEGMITAEEFEKMKKRIID